MISPWSISPAHCPSRVGLPQLRGSRDRQGEGRARAGRNKLIVQVSVVIRALTPNSVRGFCLFVFKVFWLHWGLNSGLHAWSGLSHSTNPTTNSGCSHFGKLWQVLKK
jgi:hypothetical protein